MRDSPQIYFERIPIVEKILDTSVIEFRDSKKLYQLAQLDNDTYTIGVHLKEGNRVIQDNIRGYYNKNKVIEEWERI